MQINKKEKIQIDKRKKILNSLKDTNINYFLLTSYETNDKKIKEIRGVGLMLCLIMKDEEITNKLVLKAKNNGLILFWLLIEKKAVRITPPLTITKKDLKIFLDLLFLY